MLRIYADLRLTNMKKTGAGIGNVISSPVLVEMAMGYSRSRILCAAARLGIADVMADSERNVDDIAKDCGADSGALYRLLRALASLGITSETSPGNFVLTEFGDPLRKDAPNSVWPAVVFWSDLLADNWSYLTECVRTGEKASSVMESQGVASKWSKDPEAPAIFRAVMGTAPAEAYQPIVDCWDFSGRNVVADLGGGGGSLIAAVLNSYPDLTGMLVDRPDAVDAAKARFESEGLSDRCRLVAADLLEAVPPGADVYMLKHVLHGYTDNVAVKLLNNCRSVVPSDGRVLIIEFVLPNVVSHADPRIEGHLMSDLNMLAVTGGKERSAVEWAALLKQSRFEFLRVITVPGENKSGQSISIVEAAPS
jgi:ubiquinone/menaquinone biosynthesis C-methylase UbiE